MDDDLIKLIVLTRMLLDDIIRGEEIISPERARVLTQNAMTFAAEMLRAKLIQFEVVDGGVR